MATKRTVVDSQSGLWSVTFSVNIDRPVSVVGDFNTWSPEAHPMKQVGTGMSVTTELPSGRYAFRYLAEGGDFFDDPDCETEPNGFGGTHSVIDLPASEVTIDLRGDEATLLLESKTGDDLLVIDGIGPKIKAALVGAGVTTFAELSQRSIDWIKEVLAAAHIRSAPRIATWTQQAAALAENTSTKKLAKSKRT